MLSEMKMSASYLGWMKALFHSNTLCIGTSSTDWESYSQENFKIRLWPLFWASDSRDQISTIMQVEGI